MFAQRPLTQKEQDAHVALFKKDANSIYTYWQDQMCTMLDILHLHILEQQEWKKILDVRELRWLSSKSRRATEEIAANEYAERLAAEIDRVKTKFIEVNQKLAEYCTANRYEEEWEYEDYYDPYEFCYTPSEFDQLIMDAYGGNPPKINLESDNFAIWAAPDYDLSEAQQFGLRFRIIHVNEDQTCDYYKTAPRQLLMLDSEFSHNDPHAMPIFYCDDRDARRKWKESADKLPPAAPAGGVFRPRKGWTGILLNPLCPSCTKKPKCNQIN
jgi:hypothetical protein